MFLLFSPVNHQGRWSFGISATGPGRWGPSVVAARDAGSQARGRQHPWVVPPKLHRRKGALSTKALGLSQFQQWTVWHWYMKCFLFDYLMTWMNLSILIIIVYMIILYTIFSSAEPQIDWNRCITPFGRASLLSDHPSAHSNDGRFCVRLSSEDAAGDQQRCCSCSKQGAESTGEQFCYLA